MDNLRSNFLSLVFGALLVFVTFGDDHTSPVIGNLDTIFGLTFWQALDVLYPLLSIAIFLLYGYLQGRRLKVNMLSAVIFSSFILALVLINLDDFARILNFEFNPPPLYWTILMWIYPVFSTFAFLLYGKGQKKFRWFRRNRCVCFGRRVCPVRVAFQWPEWVNRILVLHFGHWW